MSDDDIYFGYRMSMSGPPSCWRGAWTPPTTKFNDEFPQYPFRMDWRWKLKPDEIDLPLDELKKRYPIPEEKKDTV